LSGDLLDKPARPEHQAVSVLVMAGLASASWVRFARENAARSVVATEAIGDANRLHELAMRDPLVDIPRLGEAIAAAERARAALRAGDDSSQRRIVEALLSRLERERKEAGRDRTMLARLLDIRGSRDEDAILDSARTDEEYSSAFAEYGIPVDELPASESAARIRARPAAVAIELVAALDDWAVFREAKASEATARRRLFEAARLADTHSFREAIRAARSLKDRPAIRDALKRLAGDEAKIATLPIPDADLLGKSLNEVGETDMALNVLQRARERFPSDVWINLDLAHALESLRPPRTEEAIRFFTAAQAIRPETGHSVAHALQKAGRQNEAIAIFRSLCKIVPTNGRHHLCLGIALNENGATSEAAKSLNDTINRLREGLRFHPDGAATHFKLGNALRDQGKVPEAVAEFREALRLKPDDVNAHNNSPTPSRKRGSPRRRSARCAKRSALDANWPGFVSI
jgi:tetratricopeptide (TPR) repeat protein